MILSPLRVTHAELVVPAGLDISGDEGRQQNKWVVKTPRHYKLELRMILGTKVKKAHLSIYHDN